MFVLAILALILAAGLVPSINQVLPIVQGEMCSAMARAEANEDFNALQGKTFTAFIDKCRPHKDSHLNEIKCK